MTRCQNTLTYQNEDYKIIRYGIKTQLVTGYNYYITSRNYIGISLVFPSFGLFNSNGDIPTELSNFPVNQKFGLQGYSVNKYWFRCKILRKYFIIKIDELSLALSRVGDFCF